MTFSYWAFLSDGRVVSTMPCTLSMVQCRRPFAINRESSLNVTFRHEKQTRGYRIPVNKLNADTECTTEAFEGEAAVGLEKLAIREDAHLSYVIASMGRQES